MEECLYYFIFLDNMRVRHQNIYWKICRQHVQIFYLVYQNRPKMTEKPVTIIIPNRKVFQYVLEGNISRAQKYLYTKQWDIGKLCIVGCSLILIELPKRYKVK